MLLLIDLDKRSCKSNGFAAAHSQFDAHRAVEKKSEAALVGLAVKLFHE